MTVFLLVLSAVAALAALRLYANSLARSNRTRADMRRLLIEIRALHAALKVQEAGAEALREVAALRAEGGDEQ